MRRGGARPVFVSSPGRHHERERVLVLASVSAGGVVWGPVLRVAQLVGRNFRVSAPRHRRRPRRAAVAERLVGAEAREVVAPVVEGAADVHERVVVVRPLLVRGERHLHARAPAVHAARVAHDVRRRLAALTEGERRARRARIVRAVRRRRRVPLAVALVACQRRSVAIGFRVDALRVDAAVDRSARRRRRRRRRCRRRWRRRR